MLNSVSVSLLVIAAKCQTRTVSVVTRQHDAKADAIRARNKAFQLQALIIMNQLRHSTLVKWKQSVKELEGGKKLTIS